MCRFCFCFVFFVVFLGGGLVMVIVVEIQLSMITLVQRYYFRSEIDKFVLLFTELQNVPFVSLFSNSFPHFFSCFTSQRSE